MPCASRLGRSPSFGRILSYRELLVGFLVAVTLLTSSHRDVSGTIEHGWNRLQFQVGWAQLTLLNLRGNREMPKGSSAHDHVARRCAYGTRKRAHVVGTIDDHPFAREAIENGGIEFGVWVVGF